MIQNLDGWLPLMWAQLWQVTVAVSIVGLVTWKWGKRYPHLAHLLWMLVIVKSLTPPLWSSPAGMFSWIDPWVAEWTGVERQALADAESFTPATANSDESMFTDNIVLVEANESLSVETFSQTAPPPTPFEIWGRLLLAIWTCGALMLSLLVVTVWARCAVRLRRGRVETPSWLVEMVARIGNELGIKRQFRVRVNRCGFGPLVIGVFRPTLVLPTEVVKLDRGSRLEPMIAHEMIHARRGDTWVGIVQFVAQVVWWFHPLVWWANRQTNRYSERCCDEAVVADLKCRPEEYAHSLLDVLELRLKLRSVPALSGIRSSQVTTQRLQTLINRELPFQSRAPRWCWAILILVGLVILPGAGIVRGIEDHQASVEDVSKRADKAFSNGQFHVAANQYRELVSLEPDNGKAWFRLGYSLHTTGSVGEALKAHQRATQFPSIAPVATYNWACALALLGNGDGAMEKLTEAIDLGFRSQLPIQNDPDLRSLLDREGFEELAHRAMPEAKIPSTRQFDFWLGDWDVYDCRGNVCATSEVRKDENGFLIIERWNAKSGFDSKGYSFFDSGDRKWKQTWIDGAGTVFHHQGRYKDGKMKFAGETITSNGEKITSRLTYIPMPNGYVRKCIEKSTDDGESWTTVFDGTYVRQAGAREGASF